MGYLRIMLSVSLAGVLISYCVWAFETSAAADAAWPLLRAVDRADADGVDALPARARRGWGAAPEEVFASDRLLQLLGLCWVIVYGLAV